MGIFDLVMLLAAAAVVAAVAIALISVVLRWLVRRENRPAPIEHPRPSSDRRRLHALRDFR
ncbi:hypothetical protein [Propionibacterium cyclohexanicum]|uniref:hypothetical protein n=1 Tax=Propionibacterium cyclohexanicum TaxID=64702 RepID=UPI000B84BA40|nr:hypothetical protein [Propionibacterium cyclohexanicum]